MTPIFLLTLAVLRFCHVESKSWQRYGDLYLWVKPALGRKDSPIRGQRACNKYSGPSGAKGKLAVVTNREMEAFVVRFVVDKDTRVLVIDGKYKKRYKTWVASDGTPLQYGNWHFGAAPQPEPRFRDNRNCVGMIRPYDWKWKELICDKETYLYMSYLCQMEAEERKTTTSTTTPTTRTTPTMWTTPTIHTHIPHPQHSPPVPHSLPIAHPLPIPHVHPQHPPPIPHSQPAPIIRGKRKPQQATSTPFLLHAMQKVK